MPAVLRRTIVVVDDDAEMRELLRAVLESGGYRVAECGEPTEAVELVRREKPALILCDISMPGLDGYGVLRGLQSDPETACYPVVFLTAHREFIERVRAFRYGIVDYITKPFTREILLRKVSRLLDDLGRRRGQVTAAAEAARELLADLERQARTGVLRVQGEGGASHVMLEAGRVVEGQPPLAPESARSVEFRELDASVEAVLTHEPTRLRGESAGVPRFDRLPEALRSVLVVDDNDEFRDFLRSLLEEQGLRVVPARDGAEGLRVALGHRPWLIVTDTLMPTMDGVELCRQVRRHSLIGRTPVLFLSGWDDYKDRYRAFEVGATDYLSKTTPIRELLLRMNLLLERYATLGQGGQEGMRGGLDAIGAAGLLQMCHLTQLSGVCSVRSGNRLIEVLFHHGELIAADSEQAHGVEAVFELLGWTRGHFDFEPQDVEAAEPLGGFMEILLEGCRRLDERRAR
jgi:DNA-binding response OmpR family regulator